MSDTPQVTKANNIKWSKNVVLSMTAIGSGSSTVANYVVTRAQYSGDTVDLVELNDITDNKMSKDYILGMDDGGTLSLTLQGLANDLTIRSRWTIGLSIDGVTIFSGKKGVITNANTIEAQGGQPASTNIQIKILPNDSRLGVASVIPLPTGN